MLDTLLLFRLIAAFAVGSIWVAAVTVISERKGTLIGGILGGFPSTAAFSFLFIGINQSPSAVAQATDVFPLAFAVTNLYLLLYAYTSRRGFAAGLLVALLVWLALSTLLVVLGLSSFGVSLICGVGLSAVTFYLFARKLKIPAYEGSGKLYSSRDVVLRGVGAGALVAAAVLLSQIGGPLLGGVAAAFPAMFTSTLIILNHSRGTAFSRSITKPLAYSGILLVIPYGVAAHFLFPAVGAWLGTLLSYLLVIPLAFLSYYAAKRF
ncbi:MAG: hypothetical protein NWE93_14915 [Candidatus Bathyarchaeota archaeon]|nr:hypothetical protein [Candidatus Bathyarchaeota archaeon]